MVVVVDSLGVRGRSLFPVFDVFSHHWVGLEVAAPVSGLEKNTLVGIYQENISN